MYSKKWSGVVNRRADSCGKKKSQCLSPVTCANLSVNQTYRSQAGARTHEGDGEEFKQRLSAQHVPDSNGESDPPDVVPNPDGAEEGQFLHSILEEDIETLIDRPFSGPELLYAETAVTIGVDVCDVRLHVCLSVGKTRRYEKKWIASNEGEEQRTSSRTESIQEHQAGELVCSYYPIYTSSPVATSATTSR